MVGCLLEGLSLWDVFLGEMVFFIKIIWFVWLVVFLVIGEFDGFEGEVLFVVCFEELVFEVEVEYNGGFYLVIDVDLVFGKFVYLFVKLFCVVGRLCLVFMCVFFIYWFFFFVEDLLIDFEVCF